jgi:DinB superfamily
MDQTARRALIERYRDGPRVVAEALGQIGEAELDARPTPGEWTVREIVHHLADSEMTSAIRLRRLLVEDAPVITGYDEEAFVRRLTADRPLAASLDAFAAARRTTAEILERLEEADWARAGTHSESGRYSVEDWLEIYAAHAHDHAAQIGRARAATSKPDA